MTSQSSTSLSNNVEATITAFIPFGANIYTAGVIAADACNTELQMVCTQPGCDPIEQSFTLTGNPTACNYQLEGVYSSTVSIINVACSITSQTQGTCTYATTLSGPSYYSTGTLSRTLSSIPLLYQPLPITAGASRLYSGTTACQTSTTMSSIMSTTIMQTSITPTITPIKSTTISSLPNTQTTPPPSPSGLSTGAKIAIGVAVPVGVLSLIGLGAFFLYRRRKISPATPKSSGYTEGSNGSEGVTEIQNVSAYRR